MILTISNSSAADTARRWLTSVSASKRSDLYLLTLALITRSAGILLGGIRGDDSDQAYLRMAKSLLAGRGLTLLHPDFGPLRSWLPPGMSFIYLPFIALFTHYTIPLRLFFLALAVVSYLLIFRLAMRLYPRSYAFVAALTLVLYPPQWLWSTRINPHAFACQMTVIAVYLLFAWVWERRSKIGALVLGALWAFVGLTRGEYVLAIAAFAGASLFYFRARREGIVCAALLLLGWTLALAPWVARNYRWHHRFLLVASNYGDNIWIAYNSRYAFSGDMIPQPPELYERLKKEPNEVKRADILVDDAKRYIRENPLRAAKTIAGNFLNFWRPWLSPSAASPMENAVYVLSYGPLFVLFLAGLLRLPWKEPHWMLIGALIVYKVVVHIPFYTIVLQREDMMPLIVLVAILPIAHRGWLTR